MTDSTLKNIEFKTSSATGSTQRSSTGEALSNLIIGSLESANQLANGIYTQQQRDKAEANRIKSISEEQDKLLYSDLKFKTLKHLTDTDFENQTSENQSKILDSIKSQQLPEFFNREYENEYGTFLNKYYLDVNKKKNDEIQNNISDNIIPMLGKNAKVLTMNDVDFYSNNLTGLGHKDSKTKILKSVVGQIDGELQSDSKFSKMSKEQIYSMYPILNEIQDENIKSTLNARITSYDESYKKELYTSKIDSIVTYGKINNKAISNLSAETGKSFIEVYGDVKKSVVNQIDALTSVNDNIYDKQAVNLAKDFNIKIDKVEKGISSLIDTGVTDSVNGYEQYQYASRMIQNGYVPNSSNIKDLNIITGIANDMGIKINDATSFEKVAKMALAKRDNPNNEISLKELEDTDIDDIDDENVKNYTVSKAKELSRFMSKEQAVSTAIGLSEKYMLGTKYKADWSNVENINNDDDADFMYEYFQKTKNIEDIKISQFKDIFIIGGENPDGTQDTNPTILTTAQMNTLVNNEIANKRARALYEDELKAKGDLYNKMLLEAKNRPIVQQAIFNLERKEGNGDKATDIPTGKYGVTEAKKKELMQNYNVTEMSDEQARDIIMAENNITLNKGLTGYSKMSDNTKIAILDSMYNLGSFYGMKNFQDAVAKGDEEGALKVLLQTANIDGKSSIGLAKRRAENYNTVSNNKIARITQSTSGTIKYYDINDKEISSYTPKGGKHESSKSNEIILEDIFVPSKIEKERWDKKHSKGNK